MRLWPRKPEPSDSNLIRVSYHPPRFSGPIDDCIRLRIGFLIDWLDSRPEHALDDKGRLCTIRSEHDPVTHAAALLARGAVFRLPHVLHVGMDFYLDKEYVPHGQRYHADIVGHFADDELPLGRTVYERLRRVDPTCLSALANLAELERRAGRVESARALLDEAVAHATTSPGKRHGADDEWWVDPLLAARARLEPGDPAGLLPLATFEQIPALVRRLMEIQGERDVVVRANRAFAAGSSDQRCCLHVAMHLADIYPLPPPSFHESFDDIVDIDRVTLACWQLPVEIAAELARQARQAKANARKG